MDEANPAAPPRFPFSILKGEWHKSSRVATVFALLLLVFCNLPGQLITRAVFEEPFGKIVIADQFSSKPLFEHGWPLTFIVRTGPDDLGKGKTVGNCFAFWRDVRHLYGRSLIVNACVVSILALACGLGFEAWRRARKRVWQLHLRDLLVITAAASLAAAWYIHQRRPYSAQEAALRSPPIGSLYREGGITWLRICLGDEPFRFLDRAVVAYVSEQNWPDNEIAMAPHVTSRDLSHLQELPLLEGLVMEELDRTHSGAELEIPPLPRLRGMEIFDSTCHFRGINRLRSLEMLSVSSSNIDDQMLHEISTLTRLRELSITPKVPMSATGLAELADCPHLQSFGVYETSLDSSHLRAIGRLHRLTTLELCECQFAGGDLRFLSSLARLETLNLAGSEVVVSQDLAPLVSLTNLRELNLEGTGVRSDCLVYLRKIKRLRSLSLRGANFINAEQRAVEAALPDCTIQF